MCISFSTIIGRQIDQQQKYVNQTYNTWSGLSTTADKLGSLFVDHLCCDDRNVLAVRFVPATILFMNYNFKKIARRQNMNKNATKITPANRDGSLLSTAFRNEMPTTLQPTSIYCESCIFWWRADRHKTYMYFRMDIFRRKFNHLFELFASVVTINGLNTTEDRQQKKNNMLLTVARVKFHCTLCRLQFLKIKRETFCLSNCLRKRCYFVCTR